MRNNQVLSGTFPSFDHAATAWDRLAGEHPEATYTVVERTITISEWITGPTPYKAPLTVNPKWYCPICKGTGKYVVVGQGWDDSYPCASCNGKGTRSAYEDVKK